MAARGGNPGPTARTMGEISRSFSRWVYCTMPSTVQDGVPHPRLDSTRIVSPGGLSRWLSQKVLQIHHVSSAPVSSIATPVSVIGCKQTNRSDKGSTPNVSPFCCTLAVKTRSEPAIHPRLPLVGDVPQMSREIDSLTEHTFKYYQDSTKEKKNRPLIPRSRFTARNGLADRCACLCPAGQTRVCGQPHPVPAGRSLGHVTQPRPSSSRDTSCYSALPRYSHVNAKDRVTLIIWMNLDIRIPAVPLVA